MQFVSSLGCGWISSAALNASALAPLGRQRRNTQPMSWRNRSARWRPHCPASHGRIDNDTSPAFQTKLLSSVTSAGAAVLVEEKLSNRSRRLARQDALTWQEEPAGNFVANSG